MPDAELDSQYLYSQESTVRLTAFDSNINQLSSTADQLQSIAVRQPGGNDDLYPVPSTSPRIPASISNGTEQHISDIPGYMPVNPFSVAPSTAPLDSPYPRQGLPDFQMMYV